MTQSQPTIHTERKLGFYSLIKMFHYNDIMAINFILTGDSVHNLCEKQAWILQHIINVYLQMTYWNIIQFSAAVARTPYSPRNITIDSCDYRFT